MFAIRVLHGHQVVGCLPHRDDSEGIALVGHIGPIGLSPPFFWCHIPLGLDLNSTYRFPFCSKWKTDVNPAANISAFFSNFFFLSCSHLMVWRMRGHKRFLRGGRNKQLFSYLPPLQFSNLKDDHFPHQMTSAQSRWFTWIPVRAEFPLFHASLLLYFPPGPQWCSLQSKGPKMFIPSASFPLPTTRSSCLPDKHLFCILLFMEIKIFFLFI